MSSSQDSNEFQSKISIESEAWSPKPDNAGFNIDSPPFSQIKLKTKGNNLKLSKYGNLMSAES